LAAASAAHTTVPIKKAAAVYRLDLITRAATTACYCPLCGQWPVVNHPLHHQRGGHALDPGQRTRPIWSRPVPR
jgi:hypothetical protein